MASEYLHEASENYLDTVVRQNRALAMDFVKSVIAAMTAVSLPARGSEIVRVLLENGGQGGFEHDLRMKDLCSEHYYC